MPTASLSGTMEVIDNFKPQELRDYYEKWYRPDLQGIIIVGDIDADEVVEKIKKLFSPIKMPENAAKYEHYPVPNTPQAIYVVDKDKEQSTAVVNIMFKHDAIPTELNNTMARLGYDYISSVIASVVNARLAELTQKADCPFATAMVENGDYIVSKTMGAFSLVVLPKPGQDVKAVQTAMEELERAAQFRTDWHGNQRAKEKSILPLKRPTTTATSSRTATTFLNTCVTSSKTCRPATSKRSSTSIRCSNSNSQPNRSLLRSRNLWPQRIPTLCSSPCIRQRGHQRANNRRLQGCRESGQGSRQVGGLC